MGGRVSRVLFSMVISLGPFRDRPRRRLRGGSRLPASASNLLAADSEIAAGRIALFTPVKPVLVSVALARRTARQSGLSTPGFPDASLAFTRHPRSVQLGLSSDAEAPATILAHPDPRLLTCFPGVSGLGFGVTGDSNSPTPVTRNLTPPSVPKGRFELPRGYPHYALNVARLPFRHFGEWNVLSARSGLTPDACCLRTIPSPRDDATSDVVAWVSSPPPSSIA